MTMRATVLILLLFSFLFNAQQLPAAAQKVSDDQIYDNVRRKLANDPDVKGGALDVEVKEGQVTVKGKVDTERAQHKIEHVAKKVKGVKGVVNQTTVKTN